MGGRIWAIAAAQSGGAEFGFALRVMAGRLTVPAGRLVVHPGTEPRPASPGRRSCVRPGLARGPQDDTHPGIRDVQWPQPSLPPVTQMPSRDLPWLAPGVESKPQR